MNPLNILFQYSDQLTFHVSGNKSQAIERLARLTSKPVLQATFSTDSSKPSLVGNVSQDYVRLHKVTPLFGNAFKPIFVGKFQSQNGNDSLIGIFKMAPIGKAAESIFIVFTLLMQLLILPGISTDGVAVLQPTLFLIGGIIFFLLIKAYSKRDVTWIKQQIETALANS